MEARCLNCGRTGAKLVRGLCKRRHCYPDRTTRARFAVGPNRKSWTTGVLSELRGMIDDGLTYRECGARLGCTLNAAWNAARRNGLIGNSRYPRCWACDREGPNQNALKNAGWKMRPLAGHGETVTELYCPHCWAEWGWGDVLRVDVLGVTA